MREWWRLMSRKRWERFRDVPDDALDAFCRQIDAPAWIPAAIRYSRDFTEPFVALHFRMNVDTGNNFYHVTLCQIIDEEAVKAINEQPEALANEKRSRKA